MTYVNIPIETDEDALASEAFAELSDAFPEWTPAEGNLDTWIILVVARMAADLNDMASTVDDSIFRYMGPTFGVVPADDIPASATTSWQLADSAGHTIPFGTRVGVLDANLDTHEFTVSQDVIVAAGTSVANNVPIVASTAGASENDLGANGSVVELIDGLSWVDQVTLEGPTSGGEDAEDDDVYLNRLSATLRTMAPRPIIPSDFEILAKDIEGVARAVAIDGYNPGTNTYNNERTISVAVVDSSGNALVGTVKQQVDDYLQSLREVNFIVNVIDPSYTTIDVTYDITPWGGYDSNSVISDVNAAINSFLSPANWGVPPGGDPSEWYTRANVKIYDLVAVIGNVAGVKDVNSVTTRTGTNAFAANDIALTGVAPLPQPGVLTGTTS